MKVIAIIPARGGSKGIPKKNIKLLANKPLIAWTIEVALNCSLLERIIVSTDDSEIAEIAIQYGAEIPFLRPLEFAQDDTPDLPVYLHTINYLQEQESYHSDIVVWLRPTCPLRTNQDIEKAVQLLRMDTNTTSVRSVCLAEHHPYWMKKLEYDNLIPFLPNIDETRYYRRQLLPSVYRLNGAVDVTRCQTVLETKKLYSGEMKGYIMPVERSVDIDTELDLALAELLLQRREQ